MDIYLLLNQTHYHILNWKLLKRSNFLAAQTKIPDTGEAVNDDAFNAESVNSGTLYNPNPKEGIRWEGLGIIHDTETSGSQSTTVK